MSAIGDAAEVLQQRSFAPERYRFADRSGGPIVLLGSRSVETGSTYWPERLRCPRTGGAVEHVQLAPVGTLWSWTFVAVPWPGAQSPNGVDGGYGVGLVDLDDDGPRVVGVLVGDRQAWEVGERMEGRELPYITIDGDLRSILAFEAVAP